MSKTSFPRTIVGIGRKGTFARTVMTTHDLGDVTSETLMVEAKRAFAHLRLATEAMVSGDLNVAMDGFFKGAAIASNIAFTARTHGTNVPEDFLCKMEKLTSAAAHGIKHVMKAVVTKKLLKHESLFHDGASAAISPMSVLSGNIPPAVDTPREIFEIMAEKRRLSPFPEEIGQRGGPEFFAHPDRMELFMLFHSHGVPRNEMRAIPGGILVSAKSARRAGAVFAKMATPKAGVS